MQELRTEQISDYAVEGPTGLETFTTRLEAAARAKELSAQNTGTVAVHGERGRLKMLFRRGALDSMREETGR